MFSLSISTVSAKTRAGEGELPFFGKLKLSLKSVVAIGETFCECFAPKTALLHFLANAS